MKKFMMSVVMLLLAINITACGSSTSAAKPEDTQKKFEDAGWKIEMEKNPGTEVIYSIKVHDTTDQISLSLFKDEKQPNEIGFAKQKDYDTQSIFHDIKEDKDYAIGSTSCLRYNLSDNEADASFNEMGECDALSLKAYHSLQDNFKNVLAKLEITYEDLQAWGNWYNENN